MSARRPCAVCGDTGMIKLGGDEVDACPQCAALAERAFRVRQAGWPRPVRQPVALPRRRRASERDVAQRPDARRVA